MKVIPQIDFSIPERWKFQEIQGQDFWLEMPFYEPTRQIFRWSGIDQKPFFKDAVLRVSWTIMLEPESDKYKELLALPNPVVLRSDYHMYDDAMLTLPEENYRRFEKDFGDRFLGMHGIHERMGALEWGWPLDDVLAEITRKTGTPVERPKTREEAYEVMKVMYLALTQKPYYKVYSTRRQQSIISCKNWALRFARRKSGDGSGARRCRWPFRAVRDANLPAHGGTSWPHGARVWWGIHIATTTISGREAALLSIRLVTWTRGRTAEHPFHCRSANFIIRSCRE